jgi:hypothetical protein
LTVLENANLTNLILHDDWFSFWINTYNALAVKTIINNACDKDIFGSCGPISSIRNIGKIIYLYFILLNEKHVKKNEKK